MGLLPKERRRDALPKAEKFVVAESRLNINACPTLDTPPLTEEYAEALLYVSHLHKTDDQLRAENNRIPSAVFNQE